MPCWACEVLAGSTAHGDYVLVHEADDCVALLVPGAVPAGMSMVLPRRHVEDFVDGLNVDEYLASQELVYRVAAAVKRTVGVGNVVVSSMGGLPGATHVGWNLMPMSLPDLSQGGPVPFPDLEPEALRDLAARLGDALAPRKF